jgi:peptide/nickel transport system substrate-binding protein
MKRTRWFFLAFALLTISALILASCVPTAAEPTNEPGPPAEEATEAPPTAVPPTEVPTPSGPPSGGTLLNAGEREPDILDPALTTTSAVLSYLGSSLVAIDPQGNYVPYLAESWEISEDGLVWTFHLRQDVKFHNGDPLTANDFVYSFNRALDPATASPTLAGMLAGMTFSAPDDYTLVMNFAAPNAGFLFTLSDSGYTQPVNQAVVEEFGADYGRNPVSVGPWKFKEWVTGDHLTFERNPDFNWAPPYLHQGPAYLDEIVFRFIPEHATVVAGLEAGEIDYSYGLQPQDLETLEAVETIQIISGTQVGMVPAVFWDTSQWPFDDLRVRQALSYAVDRDSMVELLYNGVGHAQYGPLNEAMFGYDPSVEQYGSQFDLEKAKELMAEAGYTLNADGILEKDGQALSFTLPVGDIDASYMKTAQLLQSMWKELGVNIELEQIDTTTLVSQYFASEIPCLMLQLDWTEGGDMMFIGFHSMAYHIQKGSDPEMDRLLEVTRATTDPAARQEAINNTAKYIMENAYVLTFTAKPVYMALNNRIQDVTYNPYSNGFDSFIDAYIAP